MGAALFADHWWNCARQPAAGPTAACGVIKGPLRGSFANDLHADLALGARL